MLDELYIKHKWNLEWAANWQQDDRYYCRLRADTKPRGLHKFLEENFTDKYGGWRWDSYSNGVEVWFKTKEDMLTFKLLVSIK